jgi:GrpB-like predicted nucleotidyltransferase (UPF0157 family)
MESIKLYPHNSAWLLQFANENDILQEKLGNFVKIHHVGSTAVPGLMAKPIIDIAVESFEYPPTTDILHVLAELGYQCRGESGVKGRVWFTKGHPRKINLHYCPVGSDIVKKQIRFRDCLKRNAAVRTEYETLKLNNCKGRDIDDAAYAESKTRLIEIALNQFL